MKTRDDGTSNDTTDTNPAEIIVRSSNEAALAVDARARLPLPVLLLWLCAFAGLAVYTLSWYMPSLAQLAR